MLPNYDIGVKCLEYAREFHMIPMAFMLSVKQSDILNSTPAVDTSNVTSLISLVIFRYRFKK